MNTNSSLGDFEQLFENIKSMGKCVGRTSIRPALCLYYVLKSPDTPSSDKIIIVSALSFLILPVSIISVKHFSILGWVDEIAAVILACNKVKKHITPEIESELENTLEKWFPRAKPEFIP